MPRDFSYGDEVVAGDVTGTLVGLDYGPMDDIINATVRTPDGQAYAVDPALLALATDRNGFSFSIPDPYTLVIRRNDLSLSQSKWWRRRGLKLLRDSLAPPKRRRK